MEIKLISLDPGSEITGKELEKKQDVHELIIPFLPLTTTRPFLNSVLRNSLLFFPFYNK